MKLRDLAAAACLLVCGSGVAREAPAVPLKAGPKRGTVARNTDTPVMCDSLTLETP